MKARTLPAPHRFAALDDLAHLDDHPSTIERLDVIALGLNRDYFPEQLLAALDHVAQD